MRAGGQFNQWRYAVHHAGRHGNGHRLRHCRAEHPHVDTAGQPGTRRRALPRLILTTVDTAHRRITFDLIEFLTGDAAKQAWKKANPGSDQDGPDDDYYIVNDNAKLRTLPVAGTVTVSVLKNDGGSPDPMSITFAALPAYLAKAKPDTSDHQLSYNPFWLTVQNGQIVKIEEQFVP